MATPIPTNCAPFSLEELEAVTGGTWLQRGRVAAVAGVGTDTRDQLEGKVFVALEGERFDGHDFVAKAVDAGASVLLVSRPVAAPSGVGVLRVSDTLLALGALAAEHRRRWGGKVIAIGGAAGKTTTRAATSALLGAAFPGEVHSTTGNLNNRVGVPMVLLGLQSGHRYAVVEVGTNEVGEIPKLAAICQADLALITLVELEHTEGLGDLDGVEKEEGALLAALGPDGLALVNGDDPRAVRCLQRAQASHRMRYGTAEVAECRLVERIPNTDGGASLRILTPSGRTRNLTTSLVGLPGALAVTAAVAVVEALRPELSDETLQAALGSLGTGEGGRLQVREAQAGGAIVDDCYNANPASMRSSLGVARELAAARGRRLLLVLGEMRELGALSEAEHGRLAESLQSTERVVLVGEQMRHCAQAAKARGISTEYVADPAGAVAAVRALHRPGEIVLVKGSRGVRLERVVEALLADGGSSP